MFQGDSRSPSKWNEVALDGLQVQGCSVTACHVSSSLQLTLCFRCSLFCFGSLLSTNEIGKDLHAWNSERIWAGVLECSSEQQSSFLLSHSWTTILVIHQETYQSRFALFQSKMGLAVKSTYSNIWRSHSYKDTESRCSYEQKLKKTDLHPHWKRHIFIIKSTSWIQMGPSPFIDSMFPIALTMSHARQRGFSCSFFAPDGRWEASTSAQRGHK